MVFFKFVHNTCTSSFNGGSGIKEAIFQEGYRFYLLSNLVIELRLIDENKLRPENVILMLRNTMRRYKRVIMSLVRYLRLVADLPLSLISKLCFCQSF